MMRTPVAMTINSGLKRPRRAGPARQRGVVMVMTAIALLALLAMAGLALDGGHLLLSKTRLQNAVDAAALSAAKTLNDTNDQTAASAAATATFAQNAATPGNAELLQEFTSGGITIAPQYSATLVPFVPGSAPPLFARVTVPTFALDTWLIQIVGFAQASVRASAVAGPSPPLTNNVCKIAPMLLCGTDDTDPNDNLAYGYPLDNVTVVKTAAGQQSQVGPGNFQLIQLPDSQGDNDIRNALAGAYDPNACPSAGESVPTQPGNGVGPVVQGLNTRFGVYSGPLRASDYPPDWVTTQPDPKLKLDNSGTLMFSNNQTYSNPSELSFNNGNYSAAYTAGAGSGWCSDADSSGKCHRRILTVPVGNCTGTVNGAGEVPIYGFACVYLVQQVVQKGTEAQVYAQIVGSCDSSGQPAIAPVAGPLPTKIVLYKDPDSGDS